MRTYLAQRHRTLADELLIVKLDVVNDALLKAYARMVKSGAMSGETKAIEERGIAQNAKLVRETNCRQGYVVAHCRQYPYYVPGKIERSYRGAPPAKLLFEIGRLEPLTSHGFTGHVQRGPLDTNCRDVDGRLQCTPIYAKKP
ncbi:MAG TPA: hypothetical protein VED41_02850, partial [Solirubrobacteraceae bacterium]|nr:hypothetical protein [Solirubrobacteraceae bacterium]